MAFDLEVGVELGEDEEGVGDADGAFEEAATGSDGGWREVVDKAGEGGFELAAGVYMAVLVVMEVEKCRLCERHTSSRQRRIVLEVSRRHRSYIEEVVLIYIINLS